MVECWLKPNQRPTWGVIALTGFFAFGAGVGTVCSWWASTSILLGGFSVLLFLCAAGLLLAVKQLRKPRVSYADGTLYIHDARKPPHGVPVDIVEVFFLGSGPAIPAEQEETIPRAANVVIRLSESATQWHNGELSPSIGKWSDGYIVLSGTWCEPISHERLNEINRRLTQVHRERRESADTTQRVNA